MRHFLLIFEINLAPSFIYSFSIFMRPSVWVCCYLITAKVSLRILLGHKSLTTTVRFYCGFEQEDAFRRFDALLERDRQSGSRRNGR